MELWFQPLLMVIIIIIIIIMALWFQPLLMVLLWHFGFSRWCYYGTLVLVVCVVMALWFQPVLTTTDPPLPLDRPPPTPRPICDSRVIGQ